MSFFDSASLVQIPSGVKDGVLYSVKPIDGSGDLTFSRGSDIEATRVNANGYIEKAKVNLLLQSNTFSNASWFSGGLSETSGQSGYDGTSDAWRIENVAGGARFLEQIISANVCTASFYAKAGNLNWVYCNNGAGVYAYFNVSSGIIGITSGNIDATITSAGSGWYRCTITFPSCAQMRIYLAAADGTLSTSIGEYILLQDAQLNYGLVAQTYQETTTAAVVSGITDNMPRLSYDPANPTCGSLILEPSRTNAVTDSEYFGNWANDDINLSFNASTSPEGVVNATNAIPNTSNVIHRLRDIVSIASSASVTFSVFAKANGYNFLFFRENSTGSYVNTFFDLANGTTSDTGASIQNYGNGWYRCILTATSAVTSATLGVGVSDANGTTVFAGNGTSGVLLYGAQVESSASYSTSYIPSYGSSATRTADACSKTGIASLIGQSEGTLFVEFESGADDATNHILSLSDGTTSNRVSLVKNTSDDLRAFVASGGASQASILWPNYAPNTNIKAAISYKANEIKFYANGENAGTDTSALVPASLTQVEFETSGSPFAYPIKQLIVFPTALSATELATLTA